MIETEMIQSSLFQADQLTVSYHVELGQPTAPKAEAPAEVSPSMPNSQDHQTVVNANAGVQEISLADIHVPDFSEGELPSELQQTVASEAFQMSLPAALCDELLIEEINSIPNKMGFKIGEVADMLSIKQYVLRYWESEFDVLKPKKAANNQRYYTKKDVENAYLIRKLLHRDRFSIEGARSAMKELKTFVRAEVKKEKAISNITQRLDHLDEQVNDLISHIRKTAALF